MKKYVKYSVRATSGKKKFSRNCYCQFFILSNHYFSKNWKLQIPKPIIACILSCWTGQKWCRNVKDVDVKINWKSKFSYGFRIIVLRSQIFLYEDTKIQKLLSRWRSFSKEWKLWGSDMKMSILHFLVLYQIESCQKYGNKSHNKSCANKWK